jgi:hypothetical protein
VVDGIRQHLVAQSPTATTRNKFRLRRASRYADYELRLQDLRVLYRVGPDDRVTVTIIGRKVGNQLIVEGKAFAL